MKQNLQMSLKKQWFLMTKAGIKTEDYREITPYWCSRLLKWHGYSVSQKHWSNRLHDFLDLTMEQSILIYIKEFNAEFKQFDYNIMTLGYPKSTDTERILKLEHKGIEIRTGNPEWGAEPDKLYFVIKHGKII